MPSRLFRPLVAWTLAVFSAVPSLCTAQTFTDVTASLNMGDTSHRHFGISIVDINGDGFVDVYYANGLFDPIVVPRPPTGTCPSNMNPPFDPANLNTLYINKGDGTFTQDVAPQVGLDDFWNAMRNTFGDYDNDGDRDMISHNFIVSPLYECVSFPDTLLYVDASVATETEICLGNGTGSSWVDLDADGDLDLYGCEYDPGRTAVNHLNVIYMNDGDGTFTDVTALAGANLPDNPMGTQFADYDNDGDMDFFATNSHEVPSRLYRHDGLNGSGIPQFVDAGVEAGVAVQDQVDRGVGCGWGDYNNDGRLDMLFSREADSHLWRNEGPDSLGIWRFADVSTVNGVNTHFNKITYGMWGGNFIDLDNDGWLDVILCNRDQGLPNQVYMNNGDETFTEVAATIGLDRPGHAQMGVVAADYDNDGDLDIFMCTHQLGQPNSVYRNDTSPANNWVQFRLTGTTSNRDAVGARIYVTAEISPGQTHTQMRDVVAGTGFFSDFPRIQTFGLGTAASIVSASIVWPNGLTQPLGSPAINVRHDVTESVPVSTPLPSLEPSAAGIEMVRPNPFLDATSVRFAVDSKRAVEVTVHTVDGRRVRTLTDGVRAAGRHEVTWDGRDSSGRPLQTGVYFVRLSAGEISETRKVTLIR